MTGTWLKRLVAGAAVAGIAGTLVTGAAGTASAFVDPGYCGSGYFYDGYDNYGRYWSDSVKLIDQWTVLGNHTKATYKKYEEQQYNNRSGTNTSYYTNVCP
jgi:hypothetical protein